MTQHTQLLLAFILTTPSLASDLQTLVALSLHEPATPTDQEAIDNVIHLADLLLLTPSDDLRSLL